MFSRSASVSLLLAGLCLSLQLVGCNSDSGSTPNGVHDVTETFVNSASSTVHLTDFRTNQGSTFPTTIDLTPGQSTTFTFHSLNQNECISFTSTEDGNIASQTGSFCNDGTQTYSSNNRARSGGSAGNTTWNTSGVTGHGAAGSAFISRG